MGENEMANALQWMQVLTATTDNITDLPLPSLTLNAINSVATSMSQLVPTLVWLKNTLMPSIAKVIYSTGIRKVKSH